MNKNSFDLIKSSVAFLQNKDIYKFRDYAKSSLAIAIDVIQAVKASSVEMTFDDISNATGIHSAVVAETIRALRLGGYPFTVRCEQGQKMLISKG